MVANPKNIHFLTTSERTAAQFEEALAADPRWGCISRHYLVEYFNQAPTGHHPLFIKNFDDEQEQLRIVRELKEMNVLPNAVIHTDEFSVFAAAEFGRLLNCLSISIEDAEKFRDKKNMHQAAEQSGIRCPRRLNQNQIESATFPLVLKPRMAASSEGVKIIQSSEELSQCEMSDDLVLEEYIDGDIFHLDGLVQKGKLIFLSVGKYHGSCYELAQGKHMGSLFQEDSDQLRSWFVFAEKVIAALQPPSGAIHLEAFLRKNGERVFLEMAIRPGGFPLMQALECKYGIHFGNAHACLFLDVPVEFPVASQNKVGFWIIPRLSPQIYKSAVVGKIPSYEVKLKSKVHYVRLPRLGDCATGKGSNHDCLAAFVLEAPGEETLHADFAILRELFKPKSLLTLPMPRNCAAQSEGE